MTQHLFPRLPPEIRVKIWALSMPGPRIVEIRCGSDTISDKCPVGPGLITLASLFGTDGRAGGCRSSAPPPVTLFVCRESRAETLRRYKPMFGVAGRPGRVYFDPAVDVLYFGRKGSGLTGPRAQYRTVFALCEGDLARVRRIAVDEAVVSPVRRGFADRGGGGGGDACGSAMARAVYELLCPMVRATALEELIFVSKGGQRHFDPQDTLVASSSWEVLRGCSNRVLGGAVYLAMQDMAVTRPSWRQPVWNIYSRKSFT
jgi:hypothetical protein